MDLFYSVLVLFKYFLLVSFVLLKCVLFVLVGVKLDRFWNLRKKLRQHIQEIKGEWRRAKQAEVEGY